MKSLLTVLCLFQVVFAWIGWSQDVLLNDFRLPVITLCQRYNILLDTGSKDTWIADSSCEDCPQKISICPQSHSISQQIKYFKGSIKGDISFLSTCYGSFKIICALQAQGMEEVGAMGILGLRGNHTGKAIIKTLLQSHNVKQYSFAFYYGLKENIIFFGDVPAQFIKQELSLQHGERQWQIQQTKMEVWEKELAQENGHELFIDTGSNVLILPSQIYQVAKDIINIEMGKLGCLAQAQPFQYICPSSLVLKGTMKFFLQGKSYVEFNLEKTMTFQQGRNKFLIESGNDQTVIIGGSLLVDYIILFNLDGRIRIFETNKDELHNNEINNFKIIFAEYMAIVTLLAFASTKLYQIVQLTLNRKIVI